MSSVFRLNQIQRRHVTEYPLFTRVQYKHIKRQNTAEIVRDVDVRAHSLSL